MVGIRRIGWTGGSPARGMRIVAISAGALLLPWATAGAFDFGPAGESPNQAAVAAVLNAAQLGPVPADFTAMINAIGGLSVPAQAHVLAELGGNIQAAAVAGLGWDMSQFLGRVRTRADLGDGDLSTLVAPGDPAPIGKWSSWAAPFVDYHVIKDAPNGIGANSNVAGIVGGFEQRVDPQTRIGLALGYGYDQIRIRPEDANLETAMVGLYGARKMGNFLLDGEVSAGFSHDDTSRQVVAGAFDETARGHNSGYALGAGAGIGYVFAWQGMALMPRLGFDYELAHQSGMTENGGGAADLAIASAQHPTLHSLASISLSRPFVFANGGRFEPQLTVGYQYQWLGEYAAVTQHFLDFPAASFATSSPTVGRNAEFLDLTLAYVPRPGLRYFVAGNQYYARRERNFGGIFGVQFNW